jgi:hypothetical protein
MLSNWVRVKEAKVRKSITYRTIRIIAFKQIVMECTATWPSVSPQCACIKMRIIKQHITSSVTCKEAMAGL